MTIFDVFSDGFPVMGASWRDASCLTEDPEIFFAGGGVSRKAKKICQSCPVRDQCLELGLLNDERFGIWGGLTRAERKALKRSPA
ncbi:WhiB family transcriptional regulator [Promicromonospora aerolata]|uniref:Transcriptional regulator WhiB n=1 Tax=Promicromonospora aerolata TaxID=195749 RepID=A0ABW4V1I7_9MICO